MDRWGRDFWLSGYYVIVSVIEIQKCAIENVTILLLHTCSSRAWMVVVDNDLLLLLGYSPPSVIIGRSRVQRAIFQHQALPYNQIQQK
jgi:hypothetical protein